MISDVIISITSCLAFAKLINGTPKTFCSWAQCCIILQRRNTSKCHEGNNFFHNTVIALGLVFFELRLKLMKFQACALLYFIYLFSSESPMALKNDSKGIARRIPVYLYDNYYPTITN